MSARIPIRAGKDTSPDRNTVGGIRGGMQSVKMKSYKNVITTMNCQRQVAFSNPSEMFPCGSQLAACFLLFKLVPFSIYRNAMRNLIERYERNTI